MSRQATGRLYNSLVSIDSRGRASVPCGFSRDLDCSVWPWRCWRFPRCSPPRRVPAGDELDQYLATRKREADDTLLAIGQREAAILEMVGPLDRAAQAATGTEQKEARWTQAIELLDAVQCPESGASADPRVSAPGRGLSLGPGAKRPRLLRPEPGRCAGEAAGGCRARRCDCPPSRDLGAGRRARFWPTMSGSGWPGRSPIGRTSSRSTRPPGVPRKPRPSSS